MKAEMRIIAGRLRGLRLASVGKGDKASRLRPTSARVRTSIFDLLTHGPEGDLVMGKRALDLFAGTGAMGIEAVSRGATRATFVDNGRVAFRLCRENIEIAGISARTKLLKVNATALGRNEGDPYDLVFLDPPYGRALSERALNSARAGNWLASDAVTVVEDSTCPDFPGWLRPIANRQYRNASVWIMRVHSKAVPN